MFSIGVFAIAFLSMFFFSLSSPSPPSPPLPLSSPSLPSPSSSSSPPLSLSPPSPPSSPISSFFPLSNHYNLRYSSTHSNVVSDFTPKNDFEVFDTFLKERKSLEDETLAIFSPIPSHEQLHEAEIEKQMDNYILYTQTAINEYFYKAMNFAIEQSNDFAKKAFFSLPSMNEEDPLMDCIKVETFEKLTECYSVEQIVDKGTKSFDTIDQILPKELSKENVMHIVQRTQQQLRHAMKKSQEIVDIFELVPQENRQLVFNKGYTLAKEQFHKIKQETMNYIIDYIVQTIDDIIGDDEKGREEKPRIRRNWWDTGREDVGREEEDDKSPFGEDFEEEYMQTY